VTFTCQTPLQRLLLEQALAMAEELQQALDDAPAGHVLDRCEDAAVARGRELIRLAIEQATQQAIDRREKKTAPRGVPTAAPPGIAKGPTRAACSRPPG
jgi:hypothetical protein